MYTYTHTYTYVVRCFLARALASPSAASGLQTAGGAGDRFLIVFQLISIDFY